MAPRSFRMSFRSGIVCTFLLGALTWPFQATKLSGAEEALVTRIGGLRSVSDADRGPATKTIALQIRQLAPGNGKVLLAELLANLSTEGDPGKDTLQEVATTLADAVRETPAPPTNGEPSAPYLELAQLARYEHVEVKLADPQYAAAVASVAAIEQVRAKADFTLNDIHGKSWTLGSLKGKIVLVNFWATWCPPCRKEMPDMQTLFERFQDRGLVVLAISDEEMSKVQPFIEEQKYTYPILLDPGRKINSLYRVDGIPKSFLYDRNGRLVAQAIDMRTQRQFLEMLKLAGLK